LHETEGANRTTDIIFIKGKRHSLGQTQALSSSSTASSRFLKSTVANIKADLTDFITLSDYAYTKIFLVGGKTTGVVHA
jgi:hypothetical protein